MELDDSVLTEYAKQVVEIVNKGCEVANCYRWWKYFQGTEWF